VSQRIVIALDAMGGDHAPGIVVRGAAESLVRFPQVHFLLFGDEQKVRPLVEKTPNLKAASTIRHTDEAVSSDAKPSVALRSARRSSMRLALDVVAAGEAHGMVSAGNTGALMAMAKFVLKTLPGIDRPAIASYFPTMRGETVMLDLGANIECDADNLVQFAVMGDAFARCVLGVTQPTVGILNVGSEELKGHEEVRAAAARLRGGGSPVHFHGFVEGNDIGAGTVDVIVTDGFTGNVALKTAEGTSKLFAEYLRNAFRHSFIARAGYLLASGAIAQMRRRMDPRRYNGAMLLGLNGIAIKSHGGTDALGFANAIGVAVDMHVNGFLAQMREELSHLGEAPAAPKTAAL
jgi:phosphate acyltransferase